MCIIGDKMKTWEQFLDDASVFISFLEKGNFFSQPFRTTKNYRITTDPEEAIELAGRQFSKREDIFDSQAGFPEDFEWDMGGIDRKLNKNHYFEFESKNFNGADKKLTVNKVSILGETMSIDIGYIFQCYFNDYFPELWKEILEIYMNNGFPCGWEGEYPEGRLVVFSNE